MTGAVEVEAVVASGDDKSQAAELELVLTAAGIGSRLQWQGAGWSLLVTEADLDAARAALSAFEQDKRPEPPPLAVPIEYGRTWACIVVAAALIAFYAFCATQDHDQTWYWRGNASAQWILRGELWRVVTALTLHADMAHVAGNAVFVAVIGGGLCRAVGPGVGLWLMLLAGAGGNLLNILWRGAPHNAVGASTAVFGAIGALAGIRFVNRYRLRGARQRAWLSLAAALGLLAMIGSGPNTDILAHLFGLLAGLGLGAIVETRLSRPPGTTVQALLCTAAAAIVGLAWWLALTTAHGGSVAR